MQAASGKSRSGSRLLTVAAGVPANSCAQISYGFAFAAANDL